MSGSQDPYLSQSEEDEYYLDKDLNLYYNKYQKVNHQQAFN